MQPLLNTSTSTSPHSQASPIFIFCLVTYHRIGLSGAHHYLAHVHCLLGACCLPIQTIDKKHTAVIERKFGVGEAKYSTTGLEQACSANENRFAMWIAFAKANQKCARNVKKTIGTSDTALLIFNSFPGLPHFYLWL